MNNSIYAIVTIVYIIDDASVITDCLEDISVLLVQFGKDYVHAVIVSFLVLEKCKFRGGLCR